MAVMAGKTGPIASTDQAYVGRYGSLGAVDVLRRNTTIKRGEPLAEFSAHGLPQPITPEQQAAEDKRVARAREEYRLNTTGEDGQRYFGSAEGGRAGNLNEQLRAAQTREVTAAGSAGESGRSTVKRQLLEEGLTPEQRAAYRQDSLSAYEIDRATDAAAAQTAQSTGLAQLSDYRKHQGLALREATEQRRTQDSITRQIALSLQPYGVEFDSRTLPSFPRGSPASTTRRRRLSRRRSLA